MTPPAVARAAERVTVAVMAEGFSFSTETITVPAGAEVTIEFDNRDDGVPHNVAVYTDSSASEAIFVGDIIAARAGRPTPSRRPRPPRGTTSSGATSTPPRCTGAFIVT
ncbi:hypothetical protein [Methanoculleus chikugoensis]|uniref:hypothetical protein n=1 Tax=Methanoculleus chikugoensis TaxID=118126 RepID=UPI000A63CB4B|nr:hypothetical protein [Methanoculleus chikugoensis]